MSSIGGFFASLKLETDRSSFQQGLSALKQMEADAKEFSKSLKLTGNSLIDEITISRTRDSLKTILADAKKVKDEMGQQNAQENLDKFNKQHTAYKTSAKLQSEYTTEVKKGGDETARFLEKTTRGLMAIGGLLLGTKSLFSALNSEMGKGGIATSAITANMNRTEYNNWESAKGLLGQKNNPIVDSMGKLKDTIQATLVLGRNSDEFKTLAEKLAYLGEDIENLIGLSSSQMGQTLIGNTQSKMASNPSSAQALADALEGIMAGSRTFINSMTTNSYGSIGALLRDAEGVSVNDSKTQKDAITNSKLLNRVGTQLANVGDASLTALIAGLQPLLQEISTWLSLNKTAIVDTFKDIGKVLAEVLTALKPFAQFVGSLIGNIANAPNRLSQEIDINNSPVTKVLKGYLDKGVLKHLGGLNSLTENLITDAIRKALFDKSHLNITDEELAEKKFTWNRFSGAGVRAENGQLTVNMNGGMTITKEALQLASTLDFPLFRTEEDLRKVLLMVQAVLTVKDQGQYDKLLQSYGGTR